MEGMASWFVLRMHWFVDEPNHASNLRAFPRLPVFIPPMTLIWRKDALMHVYLELGSPAGVRTELRPRVRTYGMGVLFSFIFFFDLLSFRYSGRQTCDRKKLRGRLTRVCSHYSCMICQQHGRWHHFPAIRRYGNEVKIKKGI